MFDQKFFLNFGNPPSRLFSSWSSCYRRRVWAVRGGSSSVLRTCSPHSGSPGLEELGVFCSAPIGTEKSILLGKSGRAVKAWLAFSGPETGLTICNKQTGNANSRSLVFSSTHGGRQCFLIWSEILLPPSAPRSSPQRDSLWVSRRHDQCSSEAPRRGQLVSSLGLIMLLSGDRKSWGSA